MKITKWIIFEDSLFILFYPFLAFDIFLFYDDTAVLGTAAALWLFFFFIALVFYFYDRIKTGGKVMLSQLAEILFFSFEVLFFVGNFFLAGMFLMIMYAGNPYLI